MNLDYYFEKDSRLGAVDVLARKLYSSAGLQVHNYKHALWDTEKIIIIGEKESHKDTSLPIAAALLHDTGVSRGPYSDHSGNGANIIRDYLPELGFGPADVEEIALAVGQHNGWEHTTETSRFLFDADSLNKAGLHGIVQCLAVGQEFDLSFTRMRERFLPYLEKLFKKGFYTQTARDINLEMGVGGVSGLELTLKFWEKMELPYVS